MLTAEARVKLLDFGLARHAIAPIAEGTASIATAMALEITGDDELVRCDVFASDQISAEVLQPLLGAFLGIAEEGDTPIIKGIGR